MPLYEYTCDGCKCMWEELERFDTPIPTECKACYEEGKAPLYDEIRSLN